MAGYAATARITTASPHRVAHHAAIETAEAALVELDPPTIEEVTSRPFWAELSDIWDDVREIWRQGMDVLRDPRIY